MYPLIIDHRPPYLGRAPAEASLLTLPFGAGPFLQYLADRLALAPERMDRELLVMPTFPYGPRYEQRIRSSTAADVRVIQPEELATVLDEYDSADDLLLLDPAQWPVGDFDLATVGHRNGDYRAATHLIILGADPERIRERVERDGNGRVKRVCRLYNGATWPEVATTRVFLSLASARMVRDACFTSLAGLRSALSAKGVLSRDLPLATDVVDLTQTEGVLALSERRLTEDIRGRSRPDYVAKRAELLVGRESRIDPSARLIGPVILHERVIVEAEATIVGPTVVGSGSRIQRGAIVAQSVLLDDTVVAARAPVRHRVASGRCSTSAGEPPTEPSCLTVGPVNDCRGAGSMGAAPMGLARRIHLAVKRVVDIVFSSAALLALSPLLIVVALLIKLQSPGPVLFVHRREQRGGKGFPCLKFRTMMADAHRQQRALYKQNEVDGPQFNLSRDPRITRLGWWLRGTNIDELPQMINVLLGHMSLVGPRPSPFRENQICVPWRRARLSVRPGITGLWQLCRSADRSAGDFHQWIFYDIAYVRHFSIWLDIKILLATVLTRGGRSRVPLSWMIRGETDSAEQPQPMLAA